MTTPPDPPFTVHHGGKEPLQAGIQLDGPQEIVAEAAVERYLSRMRLNIDCRTCSYREGGQAVPLKKVVQGIHRYFPTLQRSLVEAVLVDRAEQRRKSDFKRITGVLCHPPSPEEREEGARHLRTFASLCAHEDTDADRLDYYVAAWQQLMWQVKRKLLEKDTTSEVMVVLSGPQGTGKSTALRAFMRPLDWAATPDCDFGIFVDRFRAKLLQDSYLICFDEMDRASTANIEAVKRTITAPYVQARGMHSEVETGYTRNASFLGAANRELNQILSDSTGMRRFVEVRFRSVPGDEHFGKQLSDINMELVWRSVDVLSQRPPIKEQQHKAVVYQAELVAEPPFITWAKECIILHGEELTTTRGKDAWESYKRWCKYYHTPTLSLRRFYSEIGAYTKGHHHLTAGAKVWRGFRVIAPEVQQDGQE